MGGSAIPNMWTNKQIHNDLNSSQRHLTHCAIKREGKATHPVSPSARYTLGNPSVKPFA